MKKLKVNIDQWLQHFDKRWDAMPLKLQRQVLLYFFTAYTLLTIMVLFYVCLDTAKDINKMTVEHISKPPSGKQR